MFIGINYKLSCNVPKGSTMLTACNSRPRHIIMIFLMEYFVFLLMEKYDSSIGFHKFMGVDNVY